MSVHRWPRAVLAAEALVVADVEAGVFTAVAEVVPAIPVFLGEMGATIGTYFASLSAVFSQ